MADLFSVTAPRVVRWPDGRRHLAVACFPHPRGLVYFEPFWHLDPGGRVHRVEGELRGEGPWKVGEAVIHVLGCQGADPDLAMAFEAWQQACLGGEAVPDEEAARRHARTLGAG